MTGMTAIYGLLVVLIPLLFSWLKQFSFVPTRWLPIITPIVGVLGVLLAQLATGLSFIEALTVALGAPGLAVGTGTIAVRQFVSRTIKGE